MVDIPPPPPQSAFIELDQSDKDVRERINVIRVSFAKARILAQSGKPRSSSADAQSDSEVAFDNFNQALPKFQRIPQFQRFFELQRLPEFQ